MADPKGWVSVFDAETKANQVVVADIPGASGAITVDNSGNLYACVGHGDARGLIKQFSVDSVDAAFNSGVPLSWSEGIALNPDNYDNNSAAGLFSDTRGYLFAGGSEGLTVFRPDGSSGTFDVGSEVYSSVSYNPLNDQVLVMTTDAFSQDPIFTIYQAGDFLPTIPGDANLDGTVDNLDADVLASNWQKSANAAWTDGDFNVSGTVDDADATILAANWGETALPAASVPEPGTLAMLLLGVCAVAFVRRIDSPA